MMVVPFFCLYPSFIPCIFFLYSLFSLSLCCFPFFLNKLILFCSYLFLLFLFLFFYPSSSFPLLSFRLFPRPLSLSQVILVTPSPPHSLKSNQTTVPCYSRWEGWRNTQLGGHTWRNRLTPLGGEVGERGWKEERDLIEGLELWQ